MGMNTKLSDITLRDLEVAILEVKTDIELGRWNSHTPVTTLICIEILQRLIFRLITPR